MTTDAHDHAVSSPSDSSRDLRLVAEMFLVSAGPEIVKTVARILAPNGIPVMPLKGVLLQKIAYGDRSFRPIADVDLLVPEARFFEAIALLRASGFNRERWERGEWQVTLTKAGAVPLGIDLHRDLTRTSRSGLTAAGMFARGSRDTRLFGAPIVVPSDDDLFAHLLLHATLQWLNVGTLHRPEDFEALPTARAMDPRRCARHLAELRMAPHALLMLPMLAAETHGTFVPEILGHLSRDPHARLVAGAIRALTRLQAPGTVGRRVAGLAMAPSLSRALLGALRDRVRPTPPNRNWARVTRPARRS